MFITARNKTGVKSLPARAAAEWMRKMSRTKKVILLGILIGMDVVLTRFLSIPSPITRIGFGFVPIVMVAILFGPVYAGVAGAFGDFIGATLFPIGPYFPGFTLSAFLTGLIFGLFLYNRPVKWWRSVAAALTVGVICTVGLGTLWLSILWDRGAAALIPARITQFAVMVPIQVIVINLLCYRVGVWVRGEKRSTATEG
jgi:ECF transporter S component (folate family)